MKKNSFYHQTGEINGMHHTKITQKKRLKINENIKQNMPEKFGNKNPAAKEWKLINPLGKEYFLKGTLAIFCKKYNLQYNTIKNYINKGKISQPVMSPKYITEQRKNITGWEIIRLNFFI